MSTSLERMIADFERLKREGDLQRQKVQDILSQKPDSPINPDASVSEEKLNETLTKEMETSFGSAQREFSSPTQPEPNEFTSKIVNESPELDSKSQSNSTPLSIQLESETLQKYNQRIPFRSYLETGYRKYRKWLSMTLGTSYSQHLNFCIARNLNVFKHNSMGIDLEIRYLLKRLENLFGKNEMKYYENVIRNTLKQNLDLSDVHIQTTMDSYFRNPMAFELTLSDEDFETRLKNVPTHDLDQHSFSCWRNSNHSKLNETPYPITSEDILNGESLSPPSGAHLGLQMLEISGYLPPMVQPRRARKYGVTFI